MFVRNNSVPKTKSSAGINQVVLGRGGDLMLVEVSFTKGYAVPAHKHPQQQISYVVQGRFKFIVEDRGRIISAGDSVYVSPNEVHSIKALKDNSVIVETFTPQRKDFLEYSSMT